jgi:hypothetical protein
MNIQEAFDYLNFFINKSTGNYYTVSELTSILDRGQIALYSDYRPKYATSQRIKDALSPFIDNYNFNYQDTLSGLITVPSNKNYLDLLDLQITYDISSRAITKYVPIELANQDERADALNSQVNPVTITAPLGEQIGVGKFQLYPKVQYRGTVTFFRRPVKPVFGYTTISGRVIVYNSGTSTQLEWRETEMNELIIKSLQIAGINISEQDIQQFAAAKSQQNYMGVNKL